MDTVESLLYGPPKLTHAPARQWSVPDFRAVNDQVRGGSSTSSMTLVGKPMLPPTDVEKADASLALSKHDAQKGEIIFDGFLDTTALGGAGFASQLCPTGFPYEVDADMFRGLALRCRQPKQPKKRPADKIPGGGKAPVTTYVIQLKMTVPEDRPDGRRESAITYEWEFEVQHAFNHLTIVTADWKDFKPTYRGRPKDDADPLDPGQVKEWAIMARSNFGSQSGPFELQLVTLSAVHHSRIPSGGKGSGGLLARPAERSSGEYFGFALFIFATVLWITWCLWALLPDRALKSLGIVWYPNREWAYLFPAWSLMASLTTYIGFMALNLYNTPHPDELRTITDSYANVLEKPGALAGTRINEMASETGPLAAGIYDLPLGMVSREIYL